MTDRKDPAELSRRFVDLWQEQLTALSRDPETSDAAARWWRYWLNMGVAPDRAASGQAPDGDNETSDQPATAEPTAKPARPSASASVSGDRDADMDKLARRVRELEERLAALESANPRHVDPSIGGTVPSGPLHVSPERGPERS